MKAIREFNASLFCSTALLVAAGLLSACGGQSSSPSPQQSNADSQNFSAPMNDELKALSKAAAPGDKLTVWLVIDEDTPNKKEQEVSTVSLADATQQVIKGQIDGIEPREHTFALRYEVTSANGKKTTVAQTQAKTGTVIAGSTYNLDSFQSTDLNINSQDSNGNGVANLYELLSGEDPSSLASNPILTDSDAAAPVLTLTVDGSSLKLSWNDVTGVVKYRLLKADSQDHVKNIQAASLSDLAPGTSFSETAPKATTYYAVAASFPTGIRISNPVGFGAPVVTQIRALEKITQIELQWSPDLLAQSYSVSWSRVGGTAEQHGLKEFTTPVTRSTFDLDGSDFEYGFQYEFTITAKNAAGTGEAKAIAGFRRVLSAGSASTCAISPSTSSLQCWGQKHAFDNLDTAPDFANPRGLLSRPAFVDPTSQSKVWREVASGATHSCAIDDARRLYCWGNNQSGQLGSAAGNKSEFPREISLGGEWLQVSSSFKHTCAIRSLDRQLFCWGNNSQGQLGRGSTGNFSETPQSVALPVGVTSGWVEVAAGEDHSCAISRAARKLYCWGSNDKRALGLNQQGNFSTPTLVSDNDRWLTLGVGSFHTCAIKIDKTLWCWGANDSLQIGVGSDTVAAAPLQVQIPGSGDFLSVSAAKYNTCVVGNNARMWCWGRNDYGALATGASTTPLQPTEVSVGGELKSVAVGGQSHVCAAYQDNANFAISAHSEPSIACWGLTASGQVGTGFIGDKILPTAIQAPRVEPSQPNSNPPLSFSATSSSAVDFTCGIEKPSGELWCWGSNAQGQLGTGSLVSAAVPTKVSASGLEGSSWAQVTTGSIYACGVRDTGAGYCWGKNDFGQLGSQVGLGQVSSVPSALTGRWKQLSAGIGSHTCGVRSTGSLLCWGANAAGQLGNGQSATINSAPVTVPLPAGNVRWTLVAVGERYTCGIATSVDTGDAGDLFCWGNNENGVLGTGLGDVMTPSPVAEAGPWKKVVVYARNSCALKTDNTLWCWGQNSYGQLGTGDDIASPIPVRVNYSPFVDFSVGDNRVCAINNEKIPELLCWGVNSYSATFGPAKYPIGGLTQSAQGWSSIAVGRNHLCGIDSQVGSNKMWCAGRSVEGQTGQGDGVWVTLPQVVTLK